MGWNNNFFPATLPGKSFVSFRGQDDVQARIKRISRSPLMQDRDIAALVAFLEIIPGDTDRMNQLLARPGVRELLDNPDPFYDMPEASEFKGEFEVGLLGFHPPYKDVRHPPVPEHGQHSPPVIVRISLSTLCRHMLCAGATGSGKTTAFFTLQDVLRASVSGARQRNFISIGFKQDLRHRISSTSNLLVFRICPKPNFKWNITIAPPGVDQEEWDAIWTRSICETQGLSLPIENVLRDSVRKLRATNDVITIEQVYKDIEAQKPRAFRDMNWHTSLLNRLNALRSFNKMLNTKEPFPLHKLSESYCIEFELDGAEEFKTTFSTLLIVSPYKYRIANNVRGDEFFLPVFCDEILFIGSKVIQRSSFLGDPTAFQLIRLGREFSLIFILATNEPTALSDTLKVNTAVKVLMNLGRFQEVQDIGMGMNLSREQMERVLTLSPGQAIMQIGGMKPFPITFPQYDIVKNKTEQDIADNNARLLRGTEFEHIISMEEEVMEFEVEADAEAEAREAELHAKLKPFLMDVYNMPFEFLTARYDRLKVTGDAIKKQLLKQGLCEAITINLGGKGGSAKFLAFFDTGFQFLGVASNHRIHKSNFEHSFWEDRIAKWAAPLGKIEIEKLVQSKHTDVGLATEHGLYAFEVELQNAWLIENAKRNLSAGYLKTIHCCKESNFTEAKNIVAGLDEATRANVHVCLLTEITRAEAQEFFRNILNGKDGAK